MIQRLDRQPELAVSVIYIVALFVTILDTTVVGTALPAMAADLGVSTGEIGWVVIVYLVSMAVWIPASGWLGDRFGTRRVFLGALAIFTAASILCGLSQSIGQLLAVRVIQGGAAGMLNPVGTAMLFRAFPPERRARAAAVLFVPTSIAPAMGPIVAGLLIDTLSWHWIFWVNGPVGIAAILFGLRFLGEHREPSAGRFDLPGFLLSAMGLALTMFALTTGSRSGWTSPLVLLSGGVGIASLVLLVAVELRRPEPLLNLRLLGERLFGTTNLASFFAWSTYIGWLFLMPLYLQQVRGVSPSESGSITFLEAVGMIIGSRVVSWLYPRIGPRRLVAGGCSGVAVAVSSCTWLSETTDVGLIRLIVFLCGGAMSGVVLTTNTAMFARISRSDTGRASAIFNVVRRTSAAFGVAAMATILAGVGPAGPAGGPPITGPVLLPAFHAGFAVAAALALSGAIAALWIRDADAARTIVRRPTPPVEHREAAT
jgi:EmrB/QacA subfamily drug resistance transporter